MKIVKRLLTFSICMFISPLITSAECDYEREAELARIASNVQINYTYEFVDDDPDFTVIFTNLTNDIYILYNEDIISGVGEKNINVYEEKPSFEIYSDDNDCKDEYIMTKYLSLPSYNYFYSWKECRSYPNFKYCTLWGDYGIDSDIFDSELQKYIKARNTDDTDDGLHLYEQLMEILSQPYIQFALIIFGIGIVIALISTLMNKLWGSKRKV